MSRRIATALMGLILSASVAQGSSMVQYLRNLDGKKRASEADLINVIAMFVGPRSRNYDFDSSLNFLRVQGVVDAKYTLDPNRELDRGAAAYFFVRALGWKGGWVARVIGMDRRSAYKEMVAKGYMRAHGTHTPMSGADLLGIMRLLTSNRRRGTL